MSDTQSDKESLASRGSAIFEERIRPVLDEQHEGLVVAIDVASGDYALGADVVAASDALRQKLPGTEAFFVRVGSPAVHRFGPRSPGRTA
ncbi:MAG: hypothetical protein AAGA92_13950 [Planctomycetota bacterium]